MSTGKPRTEAGVLRYHTIRERAVRKLTRLAQKHGKVHMTTTGPVVKIDLDNEALTNMLVAFALDEVKTFAQIRKEVEENAPKAPTETFNDVLRGEQKPRSVQDKIAEMLRRAEKAPAQEANAEVQQAEPEKPRFPVTVEDLAQAEQIFAAFTKLKEPIGIEAKQALWTGTVAGGMRDYRVKLFLDHDSGCYGKAKANGEPTFTLRAQDVTAVSVIAEWIKQNLYSAPHAKLGDARRVMQEFQTWAQSHVTKQAD